MIAEPNLIMSSSNEDAQMCLGALEINNSTWQFLGK